MSEVILHAGMNKTGSTSIQRSFEGYDDGKLFYVHFQNPNHSASMNYLFNGGALSQPMRQQGLSDDELAENRRVASGHLDAALAKLKNRERMIISAEVLSGLPIEGLAVMRDLFAERGVTARVVAYVREPIGYASSAFQQSVKSGRCLFHVPAPGYRANLKKLDDVFGRDNVSFMRFDPKSFPNSSVVQDFASHIGADMSLIKEQRTNESLSRRSVSMLYVLNKSQQNLEGSQRHFKARLILQRQLTLLDGRDERRRLAKIEAKSSPEEARKRAKMQKFQFTNAAVVDSLSPTDIAWMEGRSGLDLMPHKSRKKVGVSNGITSEQDLLDLAEQSVPYIQTALSKFGITPENDSALAAMEAFYTWALQEIDNGRGPNSHQ